MYIAIEGPNFSGKSTLALALFQQLGVDSRVRLVNGIMIDHPLGELIHDKSRVYKQFPLVNGLLIAAEKYHTYFTCLDGYLRDGGVIISDRYLLTCLAYDFLYEQDMEFTWYIYTKLPKADLTFFLRLSVGELEKRMSLRNSLSYTEQVFSRKLENDAFESAINFANNHGFEIEIIEGDGKSPVEICREAMARI